MVVPPAAADRRCGIPLRVPGAAAKTGGGRIAGVVSGAGIRDPPMRAIPVCRAVFARARSAWSFVSPVGSCRPRPTSEQDERQPRGGEGTAESGRILRESRASRGSLMETSTRHVCEFVLNLIHIRRNQDRSGAGSRETGPQTSRGNAGRSRGRSRAVGKPGRPRGARALVAIQFRPTTIRIRQYRKDLAPRRLTGAAPCDPATAMAMIPVPPL